MKLFSVSVSLSPSSISFLQSKRVSCSLSYSQILAYCLAQRLSYIVTGRRKTRMKVAQVTHPQLL